MNIRVLVADGRAIVRTGLRAVVDTSADFMVVGESDDGPETISKVITHRPDVLLMGQFLSDSDRVSVMQRMNRLTDPPQLLALSSEMVDDQVAEAVEAGTCGIFLRELNGEGLISSLYVAAAGGRVISPQLLRDLSRSAIRRNPVGIHDTDSMVAALSGGERRVLRLVGEGMTNYGIARELHLSISSVKTYVSRILAKLGLDNRTQAALVAHCTGLVTGSHSREITCEPFTRAQDSSHVRKIQSS
ncbi:LuxR C-terminal-related transcriptional regulator [Streptomyces vinaceus]